MPRDGGGGDGGGGWWVTWPPMVHGAVKPAFIPEPHWYRRQPGSTCGAQRAVFVQRFCANVLCRGFVQIFCAEVSCRGFWQRWFCAEVLCKARSAQRTATLQLKHGPARAGCSGGERRRVEEGWAGQRKGREPRVESSAQTAGWVAHRQLWDEGAGAHPNQLVAWAQRSARSKQLQSDCPPPAWVWGRPCVTCE